RVLGIEGGGTKTEWVLLADGQSVGEGSLPASNLKLISDEALLRLFAVMPDATHVGAFLAGCATPEDERRLRRLVAQRWPAAHIAVGSDRDSAMATCFQDRDGITVIAGTGAAVHGRKNGRIEKAGGWGQLLGDRGGGYHLAMQGLRHLLSQYDLTHRITPLAERVLQMLSLNRLQDLVDWASQADKMSVARLTPAVFEAARFGESEMLDVVEGGARILVEFTRAVAQRLDFEKAPVRLVGGVFGHHPEYVALYRYRMSVLLPDCEVEVCSRSGAYGAAWLADRDSSSSSKAESLAESCSSDSPSSSSSSSPAPSSLRAFELNPSELAVAATEQSNPRSANLDKLPTPELVELFITEEDRVAQALAACRPQLTAAVDLIGDALHGGGRLFHIGAGTSGRLGVLDASEIPPTFGAPPELVQGIIAGGAAALHRAVEGAEDQPEAGALAVQERGVRAGDVVCGIAASGRTPYVLGALAQARNLGARTVLVTCNPARMASPEPWDVEIDLPTGPEIVTGSTRLKAGTATKVTLNLLSTCAMIRLGKVRGNSMVDLNISNAKLRDRGVRLVSGSLGISYEDAEAQLRGAKWNVRACLEAASQPAT
ncbi:MAG TPA: N-acetylmuramic acid 6-phosphate etherase, partial [Chthoniobacteraceae bacterium]